MARKVAAFAQRKCQPPVIPRTGGELAIAGKREPGTFVPYDLVHHPIVAAVDKNIGDGLAEFQALRDRKEMVLTLDGRVFNQIIVTQLLRMNEHRTGHFDLVIKCERTNEVWRGAAHAGQPLRELCASFDLDISGEPAQHIIEQRYLFVRIAARTSREQISDPVNDFEASPALAVATGLISSSSTDRLSARA